jgi:dTDP-4-dehydrorhamnose reductase
MKILITGANGQLGKCIKDAAVNYPEFDFLFATRELLNIESEESISDIFKNNQFDYCINTAAYTNVEKAESDQENAFLTNAEGVKHLAKHCKENNTTLIQISTDYVFDGKKGSSYTEEDTTSPLNVYGASKLKGERYVQEICQAYYILRTSWLYSQYGHNFYNTVLRFAKEGKPLTVTTEQIGTPTNANDLAEAILTIIKSNEEKYGIYNFSNQGEATWYDFAKEILIQTNQLTKSNLAKTDYYLTFAARPKYSVLDCEKYKSTNNHKTVNWLLSLKTLVIKTSLK